MFGYFKINQNCPEEIGACFKKHYCFLCRALEKYYGEVSRFLLSYDTAVLLMAFVDDGFLSEVPTILCFNRNKAMSSALREEVSKKIATLQVQLIAAKLEDDVYDEKSVKAKAACTALYGLFSKAKKDNPQMWQIITEEFDALRVLEKNQGTLEETEQQFAKMMVRIGTEQFGMTDPDRISALNIAAQWLYFIDALDDMDKDIQKGAFNPLAEYQSFSNLKNTAYLGLAAHYNALLDKFKGIKKKSVIDSALTYILTADIPRQTIKILNNGRAVS